MPGFYRIYVFESCKWNLNERILGSHWEKWRVILPPASGLSAGASSEPYSDSHRHTEE